MAKKNSVLKKLKFGIEIELFTLDRSGYMIDAADRLIERVKNMYPHIDIKRECGKNMVEVISKPSTNIPQLMESFLEDFESVLLCADKEDIVLYSYGTYPGKHNPETQDEHGYKVKEQIFGKQKFAIAKRCIGLHFHFSLPWGVFDYEQKIIKTLISSKNQDSMLNMYNLFIAMDPALTTFAQSSPYYQGKQLGKDARMIVYRGGDLLNYPQGLYAKYPQFGALQKYRDSSTDLMAVIKNKFEDWESIIGQFDINIKALLKRGSILDTAWNPVKLNSHGTLEHRGLDINNPRIIIALATLIEYIARDVQEKFVQVAVSKDAIKYPFKKIGNTIYIPPEEHVREKLQYKAAYKGLQDNMIYEYCKGLLELGKQCIPAKSLPLIEPLEDMIAKRKTVSDTILERAKTKNYGTELSNKEAATLALSVAKDLFKEIILTKQIIKNLK